MVLLIFFKEVNITPQKIHHFNCFKAYKSVALRTFTIWCHHHHSLIPEHLHHPLKEPPTHQLSLLTHPCSPRPLPTSHHSSPSPHPPSPKQPLSYFLSLDLPFLDILQMEGTLHYAVFCVCLLSTQHVGKVHPRGSMISTSFFFFFLLIA